MAAIVKTVMSLIGWIFDSVELVDRLTRLQFVACFYESVVLACGFDCTKIITSKLFQDEKKITMLGKEQHRLVHFTSQ